MADDLKNTGAVADSKKTSKKSADNKPKAFAKIKSYFKETKSEVSKVVWPSPKQLVNNTLIVLSAMILSAVFIGLVDALFKFIVDAIIG